MKYFERVKVHFISPNRSFHSDGEMECARFRVELRIDPIETKDYTAEIAIEILKEMDKKFKEYYTSSENNNITIHVTPLLDEQGRAIYPRVPVKCSFCKVEKPKEVRAIKLPKRVWFEVAYPKGLFNLKPVEGNINYGGTEVHFEILEIRKVEVELEPSEAYSILFRGPALLPDPYSKDDEPLNLRFLPLPSILFFRNAFELGLDRDMAMYLLNRTFVEDHSSLHSLGKVWYFYKGRWLPGLSGSMLMRVRGEVNEKVLKIINYASCSGVGIKRELGFGDVLIGPSK